MIPEAPCDFQRILHDQLPRACYQVVHDHLTILSDDDHHSLVH